MKAKLSIETINQREKFQIITQPPESWTFAFASNYFGVSEYAVRQARESKTTCSILAMPNKKEGNHLEERTVQQVVAFFEDD